MALKQDGFLWGDICITLSTRNNSSCSLKLRNKSVKFVNRYIRVFSLWKQMSKTDKTYLLVNVCCAKTKDKLTMANSAKLLLS